MFRKFLPFLVLGPVANLLWVLWVAPAIGELGDRDQMLEWIIVQMILPLMFSLFLLLRRRFILWVLLVYGGFVALYALEMLCVYERSRGGPEALKSFFLTLRSPGWIVFHVVVLAFALLHTITWFNLTPQAMDVRIGEEKVPAVLVAGVNYVAWIAVSAVLGWIFLRY